MFSEFESKALTRSIFGFERARMAIQTKKGKAATGKTGSIEFRGHENFQKDLIRVFGLTPADMRDFNPATGVFKLRVLGFDKTEVPTSKLLLKMGLEALSESQKSLYEKYNLTEVKEYLDNKTNTDWPFLVMEKKLPDFNSIPQAADKAELEKFRCELLVREVDEKTLLFNFIYGGVSMAINLVNRELGWTKSYLEAPGNTELYPVHMRKKAGIK